MKATNGCPKKRKISAQCPLRDLFLSTRISTAGFSFQKVGLSIKDTQKNSTVKLNARSFV